MSSAKPPKHYREARRMDAQQRAYDDVLKRKHALEKLDGWLGQWLKYELVIGEDGRFER